VRDRPVSCNEPPPPGLIEGIRQFNQREFFECHETLETLWRAEPGAIRDLYQGILQVGVGFYHAERGNYVGARELLRRGIERLRAFQPACHGVDLDGLVRQAEAAADEIRRLGPERIEELDARLIPIIQPVGSDVAQRGEA
jgi:predicted metal-dependent hydrolase